MDGGTSDILGPRPYSKKETNLDSHGVGKGTIFQNLEELQNWLKDYAVKHHRPFVVRHSNESVRYRSDVRTSTTVRGLSVQDL